MAAHSIPDHMRRKVILSVRVTESEATTLADEAQAKGVKLPDYLRARLLDSAAVRPLQGAQCTTLRARGIQ